MLDGGPTGLQHLRLQCGHGLEPLVRAHHEQAAVPEIVAAFHVGLGQFQTGLFGKALDGEGVAAVDGLRLLDVAIPRFGTIGHDTESDHGSAFRQLPRGLHGAVQLGHVGHDVVGGHGQQYGMRIRDQGGQGQGGCSVAPDRLQHQPGAGDTGLLQLLGGQKAMLAVAHHDGCGLGYVRRHAVQPLGGVLQHGDAVATQCQELLGVGFARQRPQAGA